MVSASLPGKNSSAPTTISPRNLWILRTPSRCPANSASVAILSISCLPHLFPSQGPGANPCMGCYLSFLRPFSFFRNGWGFPHGSPFEASTTRQKTGLKIQSRPSSGKSMHVAGKKKTMVQLCSPREASAIYEASRLLQRPVFEKDNSATCHLPLTQLGIPPHGMIL